MTPMLRSGETSHIVSPPRQSLPWRIAKLHRINAHEHGAESREVEANQPNARDGEVRPGQCRAHTQQRSHSARRATDRGVRSAALLHPPARCCCARKRTRTRARPRSGAGTGRHPYYARRVELHVLGDGLQLGQRAPARRVRQEYEVAERAAAGFKLEDGRDELLGRARVEVPERLLALTDAGGADRTASSGSRSNRRWLRPR